MTVDEILVGVGRTPNVEGIGLEAVGVEYDKNGVKVNARLQTTNPRIFCGGRHLLALQIYPCRRCHGADRHSERPISTSLRFRLCQRRILDHAVVYLHGAGSRACRDV